VSNALATFSSELDRFPASAMQISDPAATLLPSRCDTATLVLSLSKSLAP
jgi:hypothetical protein